MTDQPSIHVHVVVLPALNELVAHLNNLSRIELARTLSVSLRQMPLPVTLEDKIALEAFCFTELIP